jgi:hypothetical protein
LEALLGLGFEIRLQPVQAVQMPAVFASHAVAAELSPAGGRTEGVRPELSSECLLSRLGDHRIIALGSGRSGIIARSQKLVV